MIVDIACLSRLTNIPVWNILPRIEANARHPRLGAAEARIFSIATPTIAERVNIRGVAYHLIIAHSPMRYDEVR